MGLESKCTEIGTIKKLMRYADNNQRTRATDNHHFI